jgi:molybdopterin molybdotransferase
VRASETARATDGRPVHLTIAGTIAAGDPPPGPLDPMSCYEIMTGAAMPDTADAVLKVEEGVVSGGSLTLSRPLTPGENVRNIGADVERGQTVLGAGSEIRTEHLLPLATLGVRELMVRARPRVAVIATGRELVDYRTAGPLRPGQVRNSTTPYLLTALTELGAEPLSYGTVADDPKAFAAMIEKVRRAKPDLVITTGAVSMGKFDFVPEAIKESGAEIVFHKLAIRPGKPVLFARWAQGPAFFGLPGNPVSTLVALRFLIAPFLRGQPEALLRARLSSDVDKPDGLRCFYKARVEVDAAGASIAAMPGQASFQVSPLLEANAWLILPEVGDHFAAGTAVEFAPLAARGGMV